MKRRVRKGYVNTWQRRKTVNELKTADGKSLKMQVVKQVKVEDGKDKCETT